jgi:hypothetical protein
MIVSATDWTGNTINGVTLGQPVLLDGGDYGWDHAFIPDQTVIDTDGHIFIEVPND